MPISGPTRKVTRFGLFEVDPEALELRKSGIKVNIQGQPFQILVLLLERRGAILTREELQTLLWPDGTFVDFEHSVNAAIKRLRDALGDDADNPRFIETVPRRGYRFIAPIEGAAQTAAKIGRPASILAGAGLSIGAGLLLLLGVIAVIWWFWPPRIPRITRTTRLSFDSKAAAPFVNFSPIFPAVATDGTRIYFSMVRDATLRLGYMSAAGGDQVAMTVPLERAELRHISPDGSLLLAYGSIAGETDRHLWLVPTSGGGLRRLGSIDGYDGAWSPDGREVAYAQGRELYVAERDGSQSHELAPIPGEAYWLRWSPDAKRIRFTLVDPDTNAKTLWECGADGSNLHRLSISWGKQPEECCGEWAPDGKRFYFRTFINEQTEIWAIAEPKLSSRTYKPVRMTTGPVDFAAAVPSRNGGQLLAVAVEPRWEILSYSPKTQQTKPWLEGVSAILASMSPDGRSIAYVQRHAATGATLWRSRRDGSERVQLSQPPLLVAQSRWSPDGKQIAFQAKMPDQPWNVYLVAANGGVPRALVNDGRNAVDPEWSPDGSTLMFGRPPESWAEAGMPKAIYELNLASNKITKLLGSDGMYSPRWSPDGKYVAALPLDEKRLRLFDFAGQRWKDFATIPNVGSPQWSQDSQYLYVDGFDNEVVRIRRTDSKIEKILDLKSANPNALICYFQSVDSDGNVLIACPLARGDLYALDLDLR